MRLQFTKNKKWPAQFWKCVAQAYCQSLGLFIYVKIEFDLHRMFIFESTMSRLSRRQTVSCLHGFQMTTD